MHYFQRQTLQALESTRSTQNLQSCLTIIKRTERIFSLRWLCLLLLLSGYLFVLCSCKVVSCWYSFLMFLFLIQIQAPSAQIINYYSVVMFSSLFLHFRIFYLRAISSLKFMLQCCWFVPNQMEFQFFGTLSIFSYWSLFHYDNLLLLQIADALYYNSSLTLGILHKLGVATEVFNLWFQMLLEVKKSGMRANFKRLRLFFFSRSFLVLE